MSADLLALDLGDSTVTLRTRQPETVTRHLQPHAPDALAHMRSRDATLEEVYLDLLAGPG